MENSPGIPQHACARQDIMFFSLYGDIQIYLHSWKHSMLCIVSYAGFQSAAAVRMHGFASRMQPQ
jgi:hypothetical protein